MKHLGTILAGVMAASLVAPMTPVMAMSQKEETVGAFTLIQTTEDFINAFAKYTVFTIQPDGTQTTDSVFYTEINRDNYLTILSGKAVYDTLTEEMRADIDATILANTGIPYYSMVDTANAINAEVVAEQEAAAALQAEQDAQLLVEQEEIGPTIEEAPAEVQEAVLGEVVEEVPTQEEIQDITVADSNEEEIQDLDITDSSPEENQDQADVQGPVIAIQNESEEQVSEEVELSEEEVIALEQQAIQESLQETLFEEEENVLVAQEAVQEEVTNPEDIIVEYIDIPEEVSKQADVYTISKVAQLAESGASNEEIEEKFVETYCESNNSVYKTVTSDNYQQIISGYTEWQELSLTQKTGVNQILASGGSSTYTTLYNAAQVLNGNNNTSYGGVHTSVSTNGATYSFMSALSAIVMAFLIKKRKIQ